MSGSGDAAGGLFDLTGRVAVVTGGSRGIGRAIAGALAAAGAAVVVASRKLDNCEAAARELHESSGVDSFGVAYHAGHWEDSDALTTRVYGELGRCDVLINNAGMSPLYGDDLTAITEEYYDKVTGVNLKGPFRLSSLIGQRMADDQGGSIINVSTIGSLRPTRHELVYACAKAGLNALTLGLAEAYGPKVRANAILPGAVDTDIASVWSVEQRRQAAETSLLKRMGTPQDFVGAALWLASDASSWVTGTVIRVDGGALAQL